MGDSQNLAMRKYNQPDCKGQSIGLADYGDNGFGWSSDEKPTASIEIPASVACGR
jgi:hypothetical protein